MSREWQPGDVARLRFDGSGAESIGLRKHDGWTHLAGFGSGSAFDLIGGFAVKSGPLVVIDPESGEDINRVWCTFFEKIDTLALDNLHADWGRASLRESLQQALREFASPTPPKPKEPTGLGAVVEDAEGHLWLLMPPSVGPHRWCSWDYDEYRADRQWCDLNAVRVLSEGVRDE